MSNNIRIRTTPNGSDNFLSVKIEQNFDFIEILSLKISQEKAYENFCSDYGVLIGRITINNGFGVPNVRVSIFVPIDETDKQNPAIFGLYPYETVTDVDSDGLVYNVLPKDNQTPDQCYVPVGSFPSKEEILDNEDVLYVYEKYYKYTAVTNAAGDYMIFGIPLGAQIVHIDADISDIGFLSQKPYNLIEQGVAPEYFTSPSQYKRSKKLSLLPQIRSANNGVNIKPFWGDPDTCQIGINRFDYDLNINFTPSAIFMGSLFGDSDKNSVNKNCRPRAKLGILCEQITGPGNIEMIRKTASGEIEKFDIDPADQITDSGTWAYQIPMNLDYKVTDEFGNITPSSDPSVGIATRAEVRFRISMTAEGGRIRARGKYLVPHNPRNASEIDFNFDSDTKDTSFANMYWDKIYTIKNFIPRVQKFANKRTNNYLGIKNIEQCSANNQAPFNRADTFASGFAIALLILICIFGFIVGGIVYIINTVFCWISKIGFSIDVRLFSFSWYPFYDVLGWRIKLPCTIDGTRITFFVGDGCGMEPVQAWIDCIIASLANDLGLYKFDFYNDWLNGSLYFHLFKAKRNKAGGGGRFCDFDKNTENRLADTTYDGQAVNWFPITNGNAVYYKKNFYYAPINKTKSVNLFATDLVSLGSIKDCDWQGVPRIITQLPPTTFIVPPAVKEVDDDTPLPDDGTTTTGMIRIGNGNRFDGAYFEVDCLGISVRGLMGAMNIRRQCELFVDLLESLPGEPERLNLSRYEICTNKNSPPNPPELEDLCSNSVAVNVRDIFLQLNRYGTKSVGGSGPVPGPIPGGGSANYQTTFFFDTTLNTPSLGSSFGASGDNNLIQAGNDNGKAYNAFRNRQVNGGFANDQARQAWGNSFYFYFGLQVGNTALELFKKRYLQKCIPLNEGKFIISTTVTNAPTNSGTGSMIIKVIGGTSPFIITVKNASTGAPIALPVNGNNWNGQQFTLSPLAVACYLIEVTDTTNATVSKITCVEGPAPFRCEMAASDPLVAISTNPTCLGQIFITLNNGVPPYNATLSGPGVNQSVSDGQTVTGLPAGTYTLTASDSDGGTCTKSVILKPLNSNLTFLTATEKIKNVSCNETVDNRGSYSIDITGGTVGTQAYTLKCTGGPCIGRYFAAGGGGTGNYYAENKEAVGERVNATNLWPGDYEIIISDGWDFSTSPATQKPCSQTSAPRTFRIIRYLKLLVTLTNTNNTLQCDPTKWTIQYNVGLDPRHTGVYYRNTDASSLNISIDGIPIDSYPGPSGPINITSYIPITPAGLPTVGFLSVQPLRTAQYTMTIPANVPLPPYPAIQINNELEISITSQYTDGTNTVNCRSNRQFLSANTIRKPQEWLRLADINNDTRRYPQGGTPATPPFPGFTVNDPYVRSAPNCTLPLNWSPGGKILGVNVQAGSLTSVVNGVYSFNIPLGPPAQGGQIFISVAGAGSTVGLTVVDPGSGYTSGQLFTIPGTVFAGGTTPGDDLTIRINSVDTRTPFTCSYSITWLGLGGTSPYQFSPTTNSTNTVIVSTTHPRANEWNIVPSGTGAGQIQKTFLVSVVDDNGCNRQMIASPTSPSPNFVLQRSITVS